MKPRITAYVADELNDALNILATRSRVSKSDVVEAALEAFLSGEGITAEDSVYARRLDHMSHQFAAFERDQAVIREVLALFIRYMLTVTPELDPGTRKARQKLSRERFETFSHQVAKRVSAGSNMIEDIFEIIEALAFEAGGGLGPNEDGHDGEVDHD